MTKRIVSTNHTNMDQTVLAQVMMLWFASSSTRNTHENISLEINPVSFLWFLPLMVLVSLVKTIQGSGDVAQMEQLNFIDSTNNVMTMFDEFNLSPYTDNDYEILDSLDPVSPENVLDNTYQLSKAKPFDIISTHEPKNTKLKHTEKPLTQVELENMRLLADEQLIAKLTKLVNKAKMIEIHAHKNNGRVSKDDLVKLARLSNNFNAIYALQGVSWKDSQSNKVASWPSAMQLLYQRAGNETIVSEANSRTKNQPKSPTNYLSVFDSWTKDSEIVLAGPKKTLILSKLQDVTKSLNEQLKFLPLTMTNPLWYTTKVLQYEVTNANTRFKKDSSLTILRNHYFNAVVEAFTVFEQYPAYETFFQSISNPLEQLDLTINHIIEDDGKVARKEPLLIEDSPSSTTTDSLVLAHGLVDMKHTILDHLTMVLSASASKVSEIGVNRITFMWFLPFIILASLVKTIQGSNTNQQETKFDLSETQNNFIPMFEVTEPYFLITDMFEVPSSEANREIVSSTAQNQMLRRNEVEKTKHPFLSVSIIKKMLEGSHKEIMARLEQNYATVEAIQEKLSKTDHLTPHLLSDLGFVEEVCEQLIEAHHDNMWSSPENIKITTLLSNTKKLILKIHLNTAHSSSNSHSIISEKLSQQNRSKLIPNVKLDPAAQEYINASVRGTGVSRTSPPIASIDPDQVNTTDEIIIKEADRGNIVLKLRKSTTKFHEKLSDITNKTFENKNERYRGVYLAAWDFKYDLNAAITEFERTGSLTALQTNYNKAFKKQENVFAENRSHPLFIQLISGPIEQLKLAFNNVIKTLVKAFSKQDVLRPEKVHRPFFKKAETDTTKVARSSVEDVDEIINEEKNRPTS